MYSFKTNMVSAEAPTAESISKKLAEKFSATPDISTLMAEITPASPV